MTPAGIGNIIAGLSYDGIDFSQWDPPTKAPSETSQTYCSLVLDQFTRNPENAMKAIKQIETPCEMPNGLQWTDEGLFVMDQKTDNVYVVDETGEVLRTIYTPTANGSGITVGGGYLWTASNGESASRPRRSTDTGLGYIYKLDLQTGEAVDRFRTPDGGGIHGIEWD